MYRTLLTRELSRHNLSRWIVLLLDCSMVYLSGLLACVINLGLANTVINLGHILQTHLIYLSPFAAGFLLCRTYRNIFRRTSAADLVRVCAALVFGAATIMFIRIFLHADSILFAVRLRDLAIQSLLSVTTICGMRVSVKTVYDLYLRYTTTGGAYGYSDRQLIDLEMADLLDRNPIQVDMSEIRAKLSGKRILVTGAAGSIGSELSLQIASLRPQKLILVDQAESPLHNLRLEIERLYPETDCLYIVADVCNGTCMERIFAQESPETVFHAAAYKHVPLMEENPVESVLNNVGSTRLLADLAVSYKADRFILVSTDKAVNPTNVMGCSKRICEMYCQSISSSQPGGCRFITTRFGNVLGSQGSVIPLFRNQIRRGGPVMVTHPDIIRYFMLIPEACALVLEAAILGKGGEIFAFDMGKPVRIVDLVRRMIALSGRFDVKIQYCGLRPGEKLYEELLTDKEQVIPSGHPKIKIAKVAPCDHRRVTAQVNELLATARTFDAEATVRSMKRMVPEYISNNSPYSALDSSAHGPESSLRVAPEPTPDIYHTAYHTKPEIQPIA
ncbi:polysaccharide biosynthesis protein [Duncaniella sp.]|uniref:UDP-N-acetylglucosamine 4,6-dehydratase family protein n=1 Tax=Duncaniella sp. TaxID=2518496 RepID=UPI0034258A34